MKKQLDIKKLLVLNLPYILMGLFATNFGEAWRMAVGADASAKMLSFFSTLPEALASWWPSLHPLDLLVGLCCGGGLRLAVYLKSKNAKKYRHGMEYGSARWGTHEDIAPYIDPVFQNNVILTKTESLTMNSRPKDPKTARNKNVLVIGGSGSGKTRFWLKPNLMQMHSSYVVTDPKGTILVECGKMLQRGTPKLGKDGKPMKDKHGKVIYTHTASIETQQLIIARYLEQNPEIIVVQTYIDNGATGTNFHRPGFQQMLSDIEAGLINCVIVKDLSRLGRNVIDTGYYIERYFPMQKVRFIAVNDRYDSSSPDNAHDGIIIPLRNMINEAYAMDIARKIKAQQRQAMKDGKYVGARTPYGYLKAPDDCHQLIVDPVAAEVVKTMFQWAAEGAGLNTIAVRLNEAGYLSPSHYKRTLGEITHENLVGNGHWQTRTVAKILRAEVYTGDLVQGVSKIIDHKQVRASADEWTTVRGTHEAIISRELFAAVQNALDQAAQQAKDREIHSWSPNLLRGKIFCAHCGHSLHRQKCVRRKTSEVYVYHCISNNRIKKGVCPGAFIFEKELLDALADMIQEQLDTTLGQYSLGLENLTKEAEEQKNIQAKIASRKQEIQQLRTYQRGLYEGLIQNHLSKDEYFTFKEKYEAKIEAISKEIEQLKAGLAIIAKQLEQYKMLSQDAQHIKEDRQLTAALIDRLIDRVEVSKEKRITVRFRFQSEFEHCEEVLSQCRNM